VAAERRWFGSFLCELCNCSKSHKNTLEEVKLFWSILFLVENFRYTQFYSF